MPSEFENRLVARRGVDRHDIVQEDKEFTQIDWNRRGFKKFERTVVSGRHQNVEVTIYWDKDDAMFGASLYGITTMTRDYRALISKLAEMARQRESHTFTRYIEISYETHHAAKIHSLYGRSYGGEGKKEQPVCGLRLDFHVYDISEPFPMVYADSKGRARVWRYVEPIQRKDKHSALKFTDDGWWIRLEDTVNEEHRDDARLIEYTPERWQILTEIRGGIQTINTRLESMFGERVVAKKTAAQIDSFVSQKLLPPPPKKGRKR